MHAHLIVGEVAPLVPLIIPLGEIAACIFVIGCIWVLRGFIEALLGSLSHITSIIPGIGGVTSGVIHRAESAVTDALGKAEAFFDAKIGAALHECARLIDWTYRELKNHSNLLYALATVAIGPAAVGAIRAGISVVHGEVHLVQHRITAAYARILRLEHRLQHTITAGVLPRLGRLEREYDHIIDRDIAGLRARTKATEAELSRVWNYVRSHPWTVVTDAFVGAVAVALARLGLGWIKCPALGRIGRRFGCGGFDLLEELLAAEIVALAAADLCDFSALVTSAAEGFVPALTALVDVEDALVGCHGATRPDPLPLPVLRLPPNSLGLDLAA